MLRRPARVLSLPLLATALLAAAPAARAADPAHGSGLVIPVTNPITEGVVTQVKNKVEDTFRTGGRPRTIIFDFNPVKGPAGTPNLYPCLSLADYLLTLKNRVRTVAFVHDDVSRHTVLPVLACTDLYMADTGSLGDVRGDPPEPLTETMKTAYEGYAKVRTPLSPDLVFKMLHKDMEIWQSRGRNPVRYLARIKIPEGQRDRYQEVPGLQAGTARYTAADAFNVGLCKRIMSTLRDVVTEEGLPESILRQGILPGPKNAWVIDFTGSVTAARANSLRRKIEKARGRGCNLVILELDCEGGDTQAARDFADYLRNLKDDKGVQALPVVAYVPPGRKLDAATAVALGCTEIVMGKGAVLSDFEQLKDDAGKDQDRHALMRKALVSLAAEQRYSPLLIQGTLDRDLVILLVKSKNDPTNLFPISQEEFDKDQASAKPRLALVKTIKHKGEFLKLDAQTAYDYGIASKVVDGLPAVYQHYGLDAEKVQKPGSDLLDDLENFFRNPMVRMLLVMVGIVGLILEMKMPGVGIPGVIAAVCFVIFFWSGSTIAGEFWWLAILLFVLGLILIGLEVFFLPGMAVFGISGVVLVVTSLVLVTLEKAPTTTRDWWELGMTLTTYTLSMLGAIVLAFVIARYLPQIPYANRLVLNPPEDEPHPAEGERSANPYAALLGAIGEAATDLRPAGKAHIGDDFLDVIAEGSYVRAGTRVQVIEIEGNRIVVKEV